MKKNKSLSVAHYKDEFSHKDDRKQSVIRTIRLTFLLEALSPQVMVFLVCVLKLYHQTLTHTHTHKNKQQQPQTCIERKRTKI